MTRASPSYLRSSPALVMLVMLPGVALSALSHTLNIQLATRHAQGLIVALVLGLVGWEAASTDAGLFWQLGKSGPGKDNLPGRPRGDGRISGHAEAKWHCDAVRALSVGLGPGRAVLAAAATAPALPMVQWAARAGSAPRCGRPGRGLFIPASNGSLGDGAALLNMLDKRPGPLDKTQTGFYIVTLPAAALAQLRARAPQIPLHANAGNEVQLIGLDTQWTARNLHVLLYWQVVHRVPGDNDRSFFTHLVDVNGKLWTQEDHSAYPTSSWQDGT